MIDELTRLSAAKFIPDKNPKSIIEAIMSEWIIQHDKWGKILSDSQWKIFQILGGEFNGENYKELLDVLGIRISTTAAYSYFSNGIVERHNGIIKTSMTKLRDDTTFK